MAERNRPATDTEIRDDDWECSDLSGQSYSRVAFAGVDLIESTSDGALFSECEFRNCRFNASAHTSTAFLNCTFINCSFFDASFARCKLVGSVFDRCTFGLLKVISGDWSFVSLAGADLRGSTFTGVRMREADLTGANCAGATLQHLDLSGASLHRADFTRTDLRGSDLSAVDPLATTLAGAIIDADQAIVLAGALGLDVRPDVPTQY